MIYLLRRLGEYTETPQRYGITPYDAAQRRPRAIAAEPLIQRAQRTEPDDFTITGHPFHGQNVSLPVAAALAEMAEIDMGGQGQGGAVGAGAGEVAVEPSFHQFSLKLSADNVRLDHGVHALLVDFYDVVHASEVQLDAIGTGGVAVQPAGAGRFILNPVLVAELDDCLYLLGVLG